ncbi:MAG: glycoside hydrolase family 20 zincin-like fold domain-containing protein [bacterium]
MKRYISVGNKSRRCLGLLFAVSALCVAGASHVFAEATTTRTKDLEAGGVRAIIGPPGGLRIEVDGILFSQGCSLYVVRPGWRGRFYGYEDDWRRLVNAEFNRRADGTVFAEFKLQASNGGFEGVQTIEIKSDRTLRLSVDALLTTNEAAIIEHKLGGIEPGWIVGRSYECAGPDSAKTTGLIPSYPLYKELDRSKVASGFSSMRINSRMGAVDITTTGSGPISLVDYRLNPFADGQKYFWFGVLETPIKTREHFRYEVAIKFPPPKPPSLAETITTSGLEENPQALKPEVVPDRIIPTPKKLTWRNRDFELTSQTVVMVETAKQEVRSAAEQIAREVAADVMRECVLKLEIAASAQSAPAGAIVLRLLDSKTSPGKPNLEEEYRLVVGRTITLESKTIAGLRAAAKTLRQLYRPREGRIFVRGCEIHDFPSLPMRGAHFFSGKDARELQTRMVRDILGALKLNTLVYQCDYIKWDAQPEIHHAKFGMNKDDARAVNDEALRQGIEVIPLINTFGHSEWLLANPANRELADNPMAPYAYDPSNPKVYEICGRIYREAVALFQPRSVHIGHDEITIADFPHRDVNKRAGATNLIVNDVLHWHKFLADMGIRTMIWGDLFLGPNEANGDNLAPSDSEAALRRSRLPKDIFICDWHYGSVAPEKFKSLRVFNDDGFDAAACTWFVPENILNFTRAAGIEYERGSNNQTAGKNAKGKTLGLIQTTWAGYSFDSGSFASNPDQYMAYVLAAEAAWTGGIPNDVNKLPFDYRREFSRLWNRRLLPSAGASGWMCNLAAAANFGLGDIAHGEWLGFESGENMSSFPAGECVLDRYAFKIAGSPGNAKAVLLSAQFNPEGQWPRKVTIPIGAKARALVFAVAATFAAPSADLPIAHAVVVCKDGTKSQIAWRIGSNVLALEDTREGTEAPTLWKTGDEGRMPIAVHGYTWPNPSPDKIIEKIEFASTDQGSGLIIFGITGIK